MAHYTHPEYWLAPFLPNGGDTASHLLYVGVFREWFLASGKLSGWMPEVFAGFPALLHYFPFPFILITWISLVTGLALAFKWVILLPVLLLPSAVCWSTGCLGWPWAARVMGATATVGFLLNEGSTIWGGNILAQFGGEFAFGWGLLAVVLFLGCLEQWQRHGGMGWLLAAVLAEMVSAMSHGFAILVLGFGSLLTLLLSGGGWPALQRLLQLHLLAFLLLGFWLIPLLDNLPWSIPNDTVFFVTARGWAEFWPSTFWWLAWGVPVWLVWLVTGAPIRQAGMPFLGMGLLGLLGFVLAPRLGLADVRFLPYAQLGFSVLWAGSLGWWLALGCRLHSHTPASPRLPALAMTLAILLSAGLAGYWDLATAKVSEWSITLLSGYEGRPQWSFYRTLANRLRGELSAPRVLFEHDLANNDLGSTRSLEALPFFGTRPVLEGLYMESAISAPFIYQAQAEVSANPSGPLSRYPPLQGTVDQAVQHMRELGADTLVLRSPGMQQRFGADERFRPEAEIGPFRILRLAAGTAPLVELLTVPLQATGRTNWLDRAYQRFLLDHPYQHREVFLRAGEALPAPPPRTAGRVRHGWRVCNGNAC
ncbi:MAG: 6-pyruvoyl-tetrahydropterin synthase-related protein [Magnetococcus sp. DMHC-8]